jgi:hypothetical protein
VIVFPRRNLFFPIRHRDRQYLTKPDTLSSRLVCPTESRIGVPRFVPKSNRSFGLDFQEPRSQILHRRQWNARNCFKAALMPAPPCRCHHQITLFDTTGFYDVCPQPTLLTDTAPPIRFHDPSQREDTFTHHPFTDVSRNMSTSTSEASQPQPTFNLSDFTESFSMATAPFTNYDTGQGTQPQSDTNAQYNYFDDPFAGNQDPESGY